MESNSKTKKDRSANFRPDDVDNLVKICLRFTKILENKRTDGPTNDAKLKAWKHIEKEYNALYPARSLKSLREKYDCTKRAIRKQKTHEKLARPSTGGEPPPPPPKKPMILSGSLAKLADAILMPVQGMSARIVNEDCDPNGTGARERRNSSNGNNVDFQHFFETIYFDGNSVPDESSHTIEIVKTEDAASAESHVTIQNPPSAEQHTAVDEKNKTKPNPKEADNLSWAKQTPVLLRPNKKSSLKRRIKSPSVRGTIRKTETKMKIFHRIMEEERHEAEMEAIKAADERAFVQHTVAIANMKTAAAMEMKVLRQKEAYNRREHALRMKILKLKLTTSDE